MSVSAIVLVYAQVNPILPHCVEQPQMERPGGRELPMDELLAMRRTRLPLSYSSVSALLQRVRSQLGPNVPEPAPPELFCATALELPPPPMKAILRCFGYLSRYPCLRIALFHLLAHTQRAKPDDVPGDVQGIETIAALLHSSAEGRAVAAALDAEIRAALLPMQSAAEEAAAARAIDYPDARRGADSLHN
jgi:hypothetical protein